MRKIKNLFKFIKDLLRLNESSVVIYQMGKVGSSSLEKSLKDHGLHVMHVHKLSPVNVYFYDLSIVDKFKKFRATIMFLLTKAVFKSRPCKIITIVRDPMDRNLSQMFHHIDMLVYSRSKFDTRREVPANKLFLEIFLNDINLEYGQQWMEKEFKETTGVDYKEVDFDTQAGLSTVRKGNKQIMFLRFEDLNHSEDAIGNFCDIQGFKIKRENSANNKWYNSLYKDFKNNVKIDEETFSRMYDNDFYRKFYSDRPRKFEQWVEQNEK